jgi:predicted nuclease with RNAse H fold
MGIRFFPLTLGPMRMLTERGMRLAAEFTRQGYTVVEGYPGASQDILGIPRKQAGISALGRGLLRLGLRGDVRRPDLSHDELDAATIAWVGRRYLANRARAIGDPAEGLMVLPLPRTRSPPAMPRFRSAVPPRGSSA